METFPTSELVQHQFGIVALDQSVMTVVYVSGPSHVNTWVVFEYSVGTGKILATMGVDTYQEREKAKAGEPGLEATLSPIDYLIFAGIAGPSVLRSVLMSQWQGLLKAKAIGSGVNVVAQGAADYAFTGELDYTNLAVAATVGWATGGLPPGQTGRLTSGLLGVAGAGTADLVNYEQGQSVDPLSGLNLQLAFGSNMLGHALDHPLAAGVVSLGSNTFGLHLSPQVQTAPQFNPLSRLLAQSAFASSLEVETTPMSMVSISDPTTDPNALVEQLNELGRPERRVTAKRSSAQESPTSSPSTETGSQATKVCTDVIIINDREVALACGNELVDVNDIRYGIDGIR